MNSQCILHSTAPGNMRTNIGVSPPLLFQKGSDHNANMAQPRTSGSTKKCAEKESSAVDFQKMGGNGFDFLAPPSAISLSRGDGEPNLPPSCRVLWTDPCPSNPRARSETPSATPTPSPAAPLRSIDLASSPPTEGDGKGGLKARKRGEGRGGGRKGSEEVKNPRNAKFSASNCSCLLFGTTDTKSLPGFWRACSATICVFAVRTATRGASDIPRG